MEKWYPRSLISNLVNNNVVPFVGSGFSKPSGLPLWNELILNLFRELEEDYDIQDLKRLYESGNISSIDAPEIYNIITTTKYPLRQYIKNSFDHLWKTNSYHKLLTQFQVDTILTTNFDSLIEDAYKQEGIAINTVYKNEDLPFFDEKRSIQLVKIHGTIEDINSLVFAKSEYSNYKQRNRLVYHLVSTIFLTRTILFLGFSLQDPNIFGLLDEIKRIIGDEMRTHYALMYNPRNDVVSKLLEYGIRVISLPPERIEQSTIEWLAGLSERSAVIGRTNLDKARMVNEGIANEIKGGLPGSTIRMRASLGILSNPKTGGKEPVYGTEDQDRLEIEMGDLARRFLSKDANNKIRCILHINPDLQLKKGYKRAAIIKRLEAMKDFIESFPAQIDLAHSPIPIDLNHVIVAENVSYITLQQAREIGYQRIHMKQNRWIVRSEIDNFDNDFESLQLFNRRLAQQLGIDIAASDWPRALSLSIIGNAIAFLADNSGTVLQSDKHGDIIQPISRSLAHSNGILHKSIHLHLIDFGQAHKSVWLQRRTKSKDLWEGMIDVAVAGHPETSNQLFEVLREASEELGIWLNPVDVIHLYQYPRKLGKDAEIIDVYYADTKNYSDIGRKFKSEVDSIMRVDLGDLNNDPIEAQGYVSYGSMKLPALFRLSVSEFTPGLVSELRKLNDLLTE